MSAFVVVMFVACPSTTMIGRVAFCVGLYVELVVGYAVNINCGVDVADMVILFNCWKLWGDAVRLPDEVIVTLTLNVGDPVLLELMDVDDDPVKL